MFEVSEDHAAKLADSRQFVQAVKLATSATEVSEEKFA